MNREQIIANLGKLGIDYDDSMTTAELGALLTGQPEPKKKERPKKRKPKANEDGVITMTEDELDSFVSNKIKARLARARKNGDVNDLLEDLGVESVEELQAITSQFPELKNQVGNLLSRAVQADRKEVQDAMVRHLQDANAWDAQILIPHIDVDSLKLVNGNIEGHADIIEGLKTQFPSQFGTKKYNTYVPGNHSNPNGKSPNEQIVKSLNDGDVMGALGTYLNSKNLK